MRRLIAGLTGTLVIGAVATVILAPGAPSLAASPALSVELHPPAGQVAVGKDDIVTFGGHVTPGSLKISAFLRFEGANGQRCKAFGSQESPTDLNVSAQLNFEADGTITGERMLPALGPDPSGKDAGCHGGHAILIVTARDPQDGQESTAQSNAVPIDLAGPTINEARLTGLREITVVFSEPVYLPSQPEAPVDWDVDGVPPISVSGTDTRKILTLAPPDKDEDATPSVIYKPGIVGLVPNRESYQDTSAHNKFAGGSLQTARDLIPPVIPDIASVAGKTGDVVAASDPTPAIQISNIRSGHFAELYLEANGVAGLQRPGDAFLGQDQADGSGAQIESPDLENDGSYTFYAIARDNAFCKPRNPQVDETRCPNWSDADAGSTRTYTLDRIAPDMVFAAVTGPTEVIVGFTESIVGTNDIQNWKVSNGIVSAVTGTGDRRTLTVANAVPGAEITYTPGNYSDVAGNGLPNFSNLLLDNLPPLVTVTDPAKNSTVWVAASTYDMKGSAERADQVEIYANNDGNDTPDGAAIATASVSGGQWAANVPLRLDNSNGFIVKGIRTSTTPNIIGPASPVEANLVQDSTDPTLNLDALPASAFRGEGPDVRISWEASDTNFSNAPGPIKIEYSEDGGTTWELVAGHASNQANTGATPPCSRACFDWQPPLDNTKTALIKVTATDNAGRSASKQTSPFEIDSLKPIFMATILNATQIAVGFSEPVSGLLSSPEWEINDDTVGAVEPTGPVSGRTTATLTTASGSPQIDPTKRNAVRYNPLAPAQAAGQDLHDHVGNTIIVDSVAGGLTGDGEGGGVTVEATALNACTIVGTDGADVLTGTDGMDIICPSNGDDHIDALGGNDIILTGLGNKTIDGGAGNDEINGGPDNDTLIGGSGSDLLVGDGGSDSLLGGDGDDIVLGGDDVDSIDGGSGMDVLSGDSGNDDISGGSDIDHITGGSDDDTISGGDGEDRLTGDAGDDALRGGDGDDTLDGSDGNDTLEGEAGNDDLIGGEGKDQIFGDGGSDRIDGGNGNDRIAGDDSNDRLEGGSGDDRIDGGDGNDNLTGSAGKDTMLGQDGNDKLLGSDDNDALYGGAGNDQLSGESGRDKLRGGDNTDKLLGGSGRDRLDGGAGRDFCNGGTAPDSKIGCEGGPSK